MRPPPARRKGSNLRPAAGTPAVAAVNGLMGFELKETVDRILGLGLSPHDLGFGQMAARAVIVFCFAVLLARLGDRRMLGHNAGFDIVLLVILGSVLSRGVNGQAAFFPSLGASAALVLLHDLLGRLAQRWHWFSALTKGRPCVLVRDGKINHAELRRNKITTDDLEENLRLNGNVIEPRDVAEARLERNGSISVVKTKP
jgi:uncharacterized membrane protein YcaP (DUF421 family)